MGTPNKKNERKGCKPETPIFADVYGHRLCLLFSKISYPQIYCALVLKKAEGAFFIEIFAYRWTNAEKMSVEK